MQLQYTERGGEDGREREGGDKERGGYIYIYIYIEREREREREKERERERVREWGERERDLYDYQRLGRMSGDAGSFLCTRFAKMSRTTSRYNQPKCKNIL